VDEAFSYNVTQEDHATIQHLEISHNYKRKGVFDYIYGLEHCLNKTESPYIAMLEDDVIFADGWLSYTLNNLSNLEKKLAPHPQDWLFLRIFNQERSIGWATRKIGGNHEFVITIAIAVPLLAIVCLLRRRYPSVYRYMDNRTLTTVCLVIIPAFVILFYQAGKASMLPPRPGVHAEAFGCCSQGLVFPRSTALSIVDLLRDRGSGQVDLILNDIAREKGFTRYAQYPVMMQHLGMWPTLSKILTLTFFYREEFRARHSGS
jgi:GR25 family glycosyltransferase involved in LPS biosynthesis